MTFSQTHPDTIASTEQLEDMLSAPSQEVVDAVGRLQGDVIILGAGGKMGPSLTRMIKRAADSAGSSRKVIAVSRFGSGDQESNLQSAGVETIRCDMLDEEQLASLPDAPNVVFMVGMKFGSTGKEALTWAVNTHLPGMVCRKYRNSRIVAFSTGNIYGLTPVAYGGSVETDAPRPIGDYAISALGRERIFEYFSQSLGIPVALIRLNYAVEMRYGVIVDLARRVWAGETIDVTMGNANVIWQTDANAMAIRGFDIAASPAVPLNVTGPETLSIRRCAEQFGELMGKDAAICGTEAPDALLSNAQLSFRLFGYPKVSAQQMIKWIADWVMNSGESLGKPTHFEARDGKY